MSKEDIKKIADEYGKSVTDNICYNAYSDPDKKRDIATKSAAYPLCEHIYTCIRYD